MAGTFQGKISHGDIIEYTWTGSGVAVETTDSITAVGGHFEILQISLAVDSTGATSEEFTATVNNATSALADVEFFAQNMNGEDSVVQRWANNAGILIPLGSSADFAYTNTDGSDWGLSVFVRVE